MNGESQSKDVGRSGRARVGVIVVSALFITGGFSALVYMNARSVPPTWVPPIWVYPDRINLGEGFSANGNFSHTPNPPDDGDLNSGRIFINTGTGCTGSNATASAVFPNPWMALLYWVSGTNVRPDLPPFNITTGGLYKVYLQFADLGGNKTCSDPGNLVLMVPDGTPPVVAGHGITPPLGSNPVFDDNPATGASTILRYTVKDNEGNNITDSEYFKCGPSPTPCGPNASWVNDSGVKPDEPLPPSPWLPLGPPQVWNNNSTMYLMATISLLMWPRGWYWFYIHAADCGENKICQGGLPTSDDNWGKNVGTLGNYYYQIGLFVGEPNDPPALEWVGDPGYVSDGVNPDTGPSGSSFTYKVKYSDINNDPVPSPMSMLTYIEKPCGTPIAGNPFIMTFERWVGDVDNWTQGAIYNMTTPLSPGSSLYAYYFYGIDGIDNATGPPTVPCSSGPIVTGGNSAPVLAWTGETGYTADGVNPDTGTTSTSFEYRVKYSDADNDPPSTGYPKVEIQKPCGTPNAGPFDMSFLSWVGATNDYVAGAIYTYSTSLSPAGTDWGYLFSASDGIDMATGPPTSCTNGPDVTGGTTPPASPPNLWVERDTVGNNIVLHWGTVSGATNYTVYSSTGDRFAAWPWSVLGTPATNTYTHSGVLNDGFTYFYIVRAYDSSSGLVSGNSTMGVKLHKAFGTPYSSNRNIYWMSLPYSTSYKKAKDITDELTNSKINMVCKWVPASQNSECYAYSGGRWRGSNFAISGGEGIYVNSVNAAWTWYINGTDYSKQLSFVFNSPPKANINWISLPYTNSYVTASDIVKDIEGSLGTATKIKTVAHWLPSTQTVEKYSWGGSTWGGTDFSIMPGEGYYLELVSGFYWTPKLITPAVP